MSRIPKIEINEATGATKEIFDKVYQERGNVPNMFRTVAHRPEILRTLVAHLRAIMEAPGCSPKLKELVIVRASQINRCEYWLASHSALAKRHGWPEELLKDLANFRNRPEFTEAEKVALELAERETIDAHTVDDELWARLKQHYDDGQIIELCAAIGVFNYFNRFNDALRMEPTKWARTVERAFRPASLPFYSPRLQPRQY